MTALTNSVKVRSIFPSQKSEGRSIFDNRKSSSSPVHPDPAEELWDVSDAARWLKVSERTAREWISQNKVPCYGTKGSRLLRYSPKDIAAMLRPS